MPKATQQVNRGPWALSDTRPRIGAQVVEQSGTTEEARGNLGELVRNWPVCISVIPCEYTLGCPKWQDSRNGPTQTRKLSWQVTQLLTASVKVKGRFYNDCCFHLFVLFIFRITLFFNNAENES